MDKLEKLEMSPQRKDPVANFVGHASDKKNRIKTGIKSGIKTGIGSVTDKIINEILKKISTSEFQDGINSIIISPVFDNISNKLQPYLYMISFLYVIIIVLILIIIYLIVKKK